MRALVDADTLYNSGIFGAFEMWAKFKGIAVEQRRRYGQADFLVSFEYLAREMLRIKLLRDLSFK